MANALYGKAKQAFANKQIDWLNDTIKALLVDGADYVPSINVDEFLSDIAAAAREETSAALTGKTNVLGALGSNPVVLAATSGDNCEFIVFVQDTGNPATSRLIAIYDTVPGLPVTLGGTVTLTPAGGVLFSL